MSNNSGILRVAWKSLNRDMFDVSLSLEGKLWETMELKVHSQFAMNIISYPLPQGISKTAVRYQVEFGF